MVLRETTLVPINLNRLNLLLGVLDYMYAVKQSFPGMMLLVLFAHEQVDSGSALANLHTAFLNLVQKKKRTLNRRLQPTVVSLFRSENSVTSLLSLIKVSKRQNRFTYDKHGKQQPQNVQEGDCDKEALAKAIFSYKTLGLKFEVGGLLGDF